MSWLTTPELGPSCRGTGSGRGTGVGRRSGVLLFLLAAFLVGPAGAAEQLVVSRDARGSLTIRSVPGRSVTPGRQPKQGEPARVGAGGAQQAMPPARSSSEQPTAMPRRTSLDLQIEETARSAGVDPRLVHAVIAAESAYDARALSRKGAIGLMQLMPATAAELGVADPWDPVANLAGGVRYLRQMIERFGDLRVALAAYNAGPSAVDRHGGVPPYAETRSYIARVLARYGGDGSGAAYKYRPFEMRRDEQGRLVLSSQ